MFTILHLLCLFGLPSVVASRREYFGILEATSTPTNPADTTGASNPQECFHKYKSHANVAAISFDGSACKVFTQIDSFMDSEGTTMFIFHGNDKPECPYNRPNTPFNRTTLRCSRVEEVFGDNGSGKSKYVAAFEEACKESENPYETYQCSAAARDLKTAIDSAEGDKRVAAATVQTLNTAFDQANFLAAVKSAQIADWGSMEQFLECTPLLLHARTLIYTYPPPSWSYPPPEVVSPTQSKDMSAANAVIATAMDALGAAIRGSFPDLPPTFQANSRDLLFTDRMNDFPHLVGRYVGYVEDGFVTKACFWLTLSNCKDPTSTIEFQPSKLPPIVSIVTGELTFSRIEQLFEFIKQQLPTVGARFCDFAPTFTLQ